MWKSYLLGILVGLPILGAFAYFFLLPKLQSPNTYSATQPVVTSVPKKTSSFPKVIKVLDCKQDLNCLIQASVSCQPAKLTNTKTLDIFTLKETVTAHWEIKKAEAEGCTFYLQTQKIDLAFPPNTPPAQIDEQNKIYDKLEGRDGACLFNKPDLTAMLTRWEKGTFDSGTTSCKLGPQGNECKTEGGDFTVANCHGSYFNNSL